MKSITFLLPGGANHPAGGTKVVLEYANRFASDGYEVHIVMPMSMGFWESRLNEKLRVIPRYIYNILSGKYKPYNWFNLNKNIRLHLTASLSEYFVPKSDVYIATAIMTSEYLNQYKGISSTQKFYFIQDFENWNIPDYRVLQSYNFDMTKLSISRWLKKIINDTGSYSTIIPNGFDLEKFKLSIPIDQKDKYSITMLYHHSDRKGCAYSYKALDIVKKKHPQLKVVLFGATQPAEQFPGWYEFHHMPSAELHNDIYNRSAIYIASSLAEGWGLTVGEAMICGAAIVCTDVDGFKEMVVNGESALLSPIKDPESMAANIIKLIEDDELRHKIAHNGNETIQKFTWEKSYTKFKSKIEKTFLQ